MLPTYYIFKKNISLPALAVVLSNMGDIKLKDSYTEIIKVIQFLKQISFCGCELVCWTQKTTRDSQPYKKPKHQRINDTLTKQLSVWMENWRVDGTVLLIM